MWVLQGSPVPVGMSGGRQQTALEQVLLPSMAVGEAFHAARAGGLV